MSTLDTGNGNELIEGEEGSSSVEGADAVVKESVNNARFQARKRISNLWLYPGTGNPHWPGDPGFDYRNCC